MFHMLTHQKVICYCQSEDVGKLSVLGGTLSVVDEVGCAVLVKSSNGLLIESESLYAAKASATFSSA